MNNYKKTLIAAFSFLILVALFITILANMNKNNQRDALLPETENEEKFQREKMIENLNKLLSPEEKSEEEKKADVELLEKQSQNSSDTDLLERQSEESAEDERKKALLESLAN